MYLYYSSVIHFIKIALKIIYSLILNISYIKLEKALYLTVIKFAYDILEFFYELRKNNIYLFSYTDGMT